MTSGPPSPFGRRVEVNTAVHERLLEAATAELRVSGPAALTVRLVARRADVSSATAYKVFSSKAHLLASVFLRHLRTLPDPTDAADDRPLVQRLPAFVRDVAATVAADLTMAGALRAVFLGEDPDTVRVRELVVADFDHRLAAVLRGELDDDAALTVRMAFAGAMLTAGAGLVPFEAVGDVVAAAVRSVQQEPGPPDPS